MSQIDWKGVAFWAVLIVIAALVIGYFLPIENNPIKNLASLATSKLGAFNWSSITEFLTKNWTMVTGIALTAIPLTYTTIKGWMNQKNAEKQLAATQEADALLLQQKDTKIDALTKQVETFQTDTALTDLQKAFSVSQSENELKDKKILSLEGQIEELRKVPGQICESLWAKSGGQTLEENGKLYRIVEKEKIVCI